MTIFYRIQWHLVHLLHNQIHCFDKKKKRDDRVSFQNTVVTLKQNKTGDEEEQLSEFIS